MLCEKASYLINQLRTETDISTYDEETVREIINEVNDLFEKVRETAQNNRDKLGSTSFVTNLLVHKAAMLRNKQILRWELNDQIPTEMTNKFSQKEGEYLIKYDQLLESYMQDVGLDLTADQLPPKYLQIEVRVLKDCELPSGKQLKSGTTCFLFRSDVEQLVRTGFLEHVV